MAVSYVLYQDAENMANQELSKYKYIMFNALRSMKLTKGRRLFMIEIIGYYLSIKGKLNFLQFARYSDGAEQRFRNQFEKQFDFLTFNKRLILENASKHLTIAFDPSYITKSGKCTPGVGKFWSGCAGKPKWGLEIGGIAVVDIDNHTAFHLEAIQTCNIEQTDTLLTFYAKTLLARKIELQKISKYVIVDAYFSKAPFVSVLCDGGFELISRFRDDANLRYLHRGEQTGKKGRPKSYKGKVDFKNIDKAEFEIISADEENEVYCGIVNSKALKKNIHVVICRNKKKGKWAHKLFFSTDLTLHANTILEYYKSRFQIEFLYRDAKQHTGLNHCQARSENKLQFHFNASLTTINVAKIEHWLTTSKENRSSFSMADVKTMYHNELLLKRFINVFGIDPNLQKNKRIFCELINYGKIAA